ncbi:MAG: hypothetical protein R2736_11225 [Solirubrobacterales bacterium]
MSEESLERKGDTLATRTVVQSDGGGAMLALLVCSQLCGSSSGGAGTTAAASTDALGVSAGADIPRTTVKFGMAPFIDASAYVIGVQRGWFDEVGITLDPGGIDRRSRRERRVEAGHRRSRPGHGVRAGRHREHAPDAADQDDRPLRPLHGQLPARSAGRECRARLGLVDSGTPFSDAIKEVMQQIRGKQVAVNNRGQQRAFIDGIFRLGGVSFDDVKLTASTDAQILALARRSDRLRHPDERPRSSSCWLAAGCRSSRRPTYWTGRPRRSAQRHADCGHEGPALTEDYYEKNRRHAFASCRSCSA